MIMNGASQFHSFHLLSRPGSLYGHYSKVKYFPGQVETRSWQGLKYSFVYLAKLSLTETNSKTHEHISALTTYLLRN